MKTEVSARRGLRRGRYWRRAGATGVAIASVAAVALSTAAGAVAQVRVSHAAVASAVTSQLAKFEAPVTSYQMPNRSLKHPAKLKGKTIEDIPVLERCSRVLPDRGRTERTRRRQLAPR